MASTVWWKVLRRNRRSGSSRSGGRNQGTPSRIDHHPGVAVVDARVGRGSGCGGGGRAAPGCRGWWVRRGTTRSRGAPRTATAGWCSRARCSRGRGRPGRPAGRRWRGGRGCPSPAPGPALSRTTRSMTASQAIRVRAPRSTRSPSVVTAAPAPSAPASWSGVVTTTTRGTARAARCRATGASRVAASVVALRWRRRRGRGTRRRRRPSPRGRRRGADHGSAVSTSAPSAPPAARSVSTRWSSTVANFNPVHWSSWPLTRTIPVWSVATDRCRRSRAFSSYRSPRSGVITDSRCRDRSSAVVGLERAGVLGQQVVDLVPPLPHHPARQPLERAPRRRRRAHGTPHRPPAPHPARAGSRCRGRSASRSPRRPTPAWGRPGTGP